MSDSRIEWTTKTWNPLVGCSKTSPGCDRCYAIGVAHRAMQPAHRGLTVMTEGGADWTGEVRALPDRLDTPEQWSKPCLVFVNSMSDLFHPDVPGDFIVQVFATMALTPRHTYQVLTKRAQRMARWTSEETNGCLVNVEVAHRLGIRTADFAPLDSSVAARRLGAAVGDARVAAGLERYSGWPLPNVWLGTSIEHDRYAFRADHLRKTPTAVPWLSCEPLLGPLPSLDLTGIGWVVVGGESGPKARPMDPAWARDIRDRCAAAGVPFFFKQAGAVLAREWGMTSRAGHDLDELPDDLRIRQMPRDTTGDVR